MHMLKNLAESEPEGEERYIAFAFFSLVAVSQSTKDKPHHALVHILCSLDFILQT